MKKIIAFTLSLLLVFTFFSCEADPGNNISEEEQVAVNSRVADFLNSINLSRLVVNAFNGESNISYTSSDSHELLIEFDNYAGSSLSKDYGIEKIISGSLLFEFLEGTKSIASSYTVKTVEPLVIVYSDAAEDINIEFKSASSICNIEFETTEDAITAISSDSVSFTKPSEMFLITVDGADVQYDKVIEGVALEEESVPVKEDKPVVPSEPVVDEEELRKEASAAFLAIMKNFTPQQFIADVLQTHRDIGGVAEGSEGSGNTGVADYYPLCGEISGDGLMSFALVGTGDMLIALKYDEEALFPQGIKFKSLHLVSDKDAKTASVTLAMDFVEDYTGCFTEGSGYAIKAGSVAYLQLSSSAYEFGGYGSGKENIVMPLDKFLVSTIPTSDSVTDETSLIVITPDGEKEIEITDLSGKASGDILGDIQIMPELGLEISLTVNGIEAPVPGGETIAIDDISVDFAEILASFTESLQPVDPPVEGGETEKIPEPEV